jgi:hypothetical protein
MKFKVIKGGDVPPHPSSEDHIKLAVRAAAFCDLSFLQSLPFQKAELTPERKERLRQLADRFNLRHRQ